MPAIDPVFPLPVILVLVLAPAALLVYRALRGRKPVPRWLVVPIALFRFAALTLIALLLLNPVEPVTTSSPGFSTLFIVDRSGSMGLGPDGGATRLDEAAGWVAETGGRLEKTGTGHLVVRTFGTTLGEPLGAGGLDAITPDGTATYLAASLTELSESGKTPGHIHIVSDGRIHDRNGLSTAIGRLCSAGCTISTHTVGSDTPPRNAWIARVDAPRIVRAGARVGVTATIRTSGLPTGQQLALTLKGPDGEPMAGKFVAAADEAVCLFEFPVGIRTATYSLDLELTPGEIIARDNSAAFTIEVSNARIRVLYAEGTHDKRKLTDSGLCWNDMEFITRALETAGDIECTPLTCHNNGLRNACSLFQVSFHNGEMLLNRNGTFPSTRADLYSHDVVIVSDMAIGNFSQEQQQWVADLVLERGGGFLMAGGLSSFDCGNYDKSPWERITPVDMINHGNGQTAQTFRMVIPKAARVHPIWQFSDDPAENERILDSHPEWYGSNLVRRVKPGAVILANRPEAADYPVIAAQSYGRGRSIALLPDPNGDWGTRALAWSPPGREWSAPRIRLGYPILQFNEAASHPPPGVVLKEHPSPYYAKFWVNVVRWLGENSIRWKRDKLSGRALAATATPGGILPVAAEVLAVTDATALEALGVGGRFELPGSPRVSLEYDRDRREFVGMLPIPETVSSREVRIIFDVTVDGMSHSDIIPVTVLTTNREFAETRPDPVLMAEIATAGGSQHCATPGETAAMIAGLARKATDTAVTAWWRPLWPRWEPWAALACLLCLEWFLRRHGNSLSNNQSASREIRHP